MIIGSAVPIILIDTSNNRPDYEYYGCIGTALLPIRSVWQLLVLWTLWIKCYVKSCFQLILTLY